MTEGSSPPPLDVQVQLVIDRATIPQRREAPRLATQLADVERTDVPTPHGHVAAWRVGAGPAVLLVHGWQDSAELWDPLMAELTRRQRAFVALDLPAHGFSEGERCLTDEVPDAVLAVAAALGPVDAAVAHSFASRGTAYAVTEGAPFDRMVLIAPPLSYRAEFRSPTEAPDGGTQRWQRLADKLGFDPSVGDLACKQHLAGVAPARAHWNLRNGLARLPVDVLLMASVDDERFDIDAARALAASVPRCQLVELAGLDHRSSARDLTAVAAIAGFVA